jgi:hypothetical protein
MFCWEKNSIICHFEKKLYIDFYLSRYFTLTLVIFWTIRRKNLESTERGYRLCWQKTLFVSLFGAQTRLQNMNSLESESSSLKYSSKELKKNCLCQKKLNFDDIFCTLRGKTFIFGVKIFDLVTFPLIQV